MPAAPDLRGSEHPPAAAHVAEGALPGAVGPATGNPGDSGDGAARAPGLGGGLVPRAPGHSVGLALVFGHMGVDEADDVGADGGLENVRERNGAGSVRRHVALQRLHGNKRPCGGGGHCCCEGEARVY